MASKKPKTVAPPLAPEADIKFTKPMINVFMVLVGAEGRWVAVPGLAARLKVPRQNLHYAISQLVNIGVVERAGDLRPIHIRVKAPMTSTEQSVYERLLKAKEVFAEA